MDHSHRVAQFYGYSVCLVAVIALLITLANLIGAFFDLSDPMHAWSQRNGPSLVTYENYRLDVQTSLPEGQSLPDETTLRAMYEAARSDRIASVRFRARRDITINGLLLLICVILFFTHWRWVRRMSAAGG